MRVILNYFSEFLQMIPTIGFWDILDILVVAFIVYKGINMIHSLESPDSGSVPRRGMPS